MPVLAIGAVDLIAFAVALAAILMVFAAYAFFYPLVGLLNSVPIPFVKLGDAISAGLKLAMQGLIAIYDAAVPDGAHFLYTLGMGAWHLVYNLTQGVTQALGLANQAVSAAGAVAAQLPIDISGAISSANSYADGVLATAEAAALAEVNSLAGAVRSDFTTLEGDITTQVDTLAGAVRDDFATLLNDISGAETAAIDHADGLFQQATADLQADISTAIAHTDALFDTAITHADDLFNQALQDLTDTVGALGVGAIAAEIAGVIPRVATLEAEAAECLEPLCDTITPNAPSLGRIGQFLSNLETLGVDAFIVALATEAVTDPQAVVTDITTVVNDVGGPIMTGFRDLIGV